MGYTTQSSDYYKNPTTMTTKTYTSNGYTIEMYFLDVPYEHYGTRRYTNKYQTSQTKLTDNDYGYGNALSQMYLYLCIKDSSGQYISYKDSSGQLKVTLGGSIYTFSLSSLSFSSRRSMYDKSDLAPLSAKLSLGEHYHNPLDGSRTSDTTVVEFISSDSSKINYKPSSFSVSYTSLKLPSIITTNYLTLWLAPNMSYSTSYNFIINCNRNNSSLTHDIKITIGASELYRGNGSPSSNAFDNYTLATNVGSSYSISMSSLYNLVHPKVKSTSTRELMYIRCDTKYNGKVVGTTFGMVTIYLKNEVGEEVLQDLQITNSTTFNNTMYLINGIPNSNKISLTGSVKNCNSSSTQYVSSIEVWNQEYGNSGTKGEKLSKSVGKFSSYSMSFQFSGSKFPLKADGVSSITSGAYTAESVLSGQIYINVKGYYIDTVYAHDPKTIATLLSLSRGITGCEYRQPTMTGVNIYRVNADDIPDSEGEYIHVAASGTVCSFESWVNECWNPVVFGPFFNYNYRTLKLKYKKQSETSWTTVTLVPQNNDTTFQYNQRVSGYSLDAGVPYDITLELSDRYGTLSYNTTLRPPIILIDYNKSGKSLSFGKLSEAKAEDTIIETIMPIIFSDTQNRVSSLNSGTLAAITQYSTNTSNYFNIFVQRQSGSNSRAYGITTKDTDSSSDGLMRLNCFQSRLDIMYKKMQFYQWANDYYWEVAPESTYCNMNTNSSYFYFNKPIYVQGTNIISQLSSLSSSISSINSSLSTINSNISSIQSTIKTLAVLGGNTKSELTNFNGYFGQNKMYLGKNGETIFQIHWGFTKVGTVPSSYDGQYCLNATINFTTSFGKAPIVVATPKLSRGATQNHWKCDCTIRSVSTSSFAIDLTAEGWQGEAKVFWFAIGSY